MEQIVPQVSQQKHSITLNIESMSDITPLICYQWPILTTIELNQHKGEFVVLNQEILAKFTRKKTYGRTWNTCLHKDLMLWQKKNKNELELKTHKKEIRVNNI